MLRGRIVAANGIQAEDIKPQPTTPPGCCKATAASPMPSEVPDGSRLVEGEWWAPDYAGPPLVSFEKKHRRRPRPQARRSRSPSTCSAATSPRGSPICARVDWESLGINFVHGVLAQHFRRRAAHRSRHADLCRTAARRRRRAPSSARSATTFPMVTTVRVKEALEAIGAIVANLVLAIRGASAHHAGRRGAGAGRRARRRPPPPRLRRGHPQDAWRDAAAADRRLCASNICCSAPPPRCSAC